MARFAPSILTLEKPCDDEAGGVQQTVLGVLCSIGHLLEPGFNAQAQGGLLCHRFHFVAVVTAWPQHFD